MEIGEWFRLRRIPGSVFKVNHFYKGDIVCYGGDRNPEGRRQFHAFAVTEQFIKVKAPFK